MEMFWQDVRYGFRMLIKNPAFTTVVVVSLALGIGANTTIFTLINALFLNPMPVEDASRIMMVFTLDENNRQQNFTFLPTSYPNYTDYRDKNEVFSGLAVIGGTGMSLASGGDPDQIFAQVVSGNYFDVLGVQFPLGRGFLPEEDKTLGSHPVVVLSDGLWKRRFGADRGILNQTILLNRMKFTVVGVAPPGFRGTNAIGGPALWVPLAMREQVYTGLQREWVNERRALIFFIVGRLKSGVSVAQAEAAMKTLARQLEQEYPRENEKRSVTLVPLTEAALNPNQRGDFVRASALLMGAVGLVLLIACGNAANLLLSRATGRHREMAIRLSLGAGRSRLVRQLLTESVLLSLAAGGVGLLLAFWGRDLLWALRPAFFNPNALDLALDARVLGFTLGVSLLTGILFGLVPAFQASRPDLMIALKDRANPPSGFGWFGPRNILVATQVALSLVALVGAGLFVRSLQNAQQIDPGFDTENVLLMSFDVGALGYDNPRSQEFYRQVAERLKTLPMVESSAVAANAPFAGGFSRTAFREDADTRDRRSGRLMLVNAVQTGFFEATGIRILRGRKFTDADREGAPMVAIVNDTFAKTIFPNEEALGKRIRFFGEEWLVEIVGVSETSKYITLGEDPQPAVYFPILQHPTPAVTLYVRTKGDPTAALGTVRGAVQELDRNLPLTDVATMPQVMGQSLWAPRMGAGLLGLLGGLALLLAAVGVYGVMSYTVSQRTQEIGIRVALGAQRGDLIGMILRQGMVIVVAGVVLGVGGALALTRGLASLLFDVNTADPVTYGLTAVLLIVVALLACYVPARRATQIDPIVALRYE